MFITDGIVVILSLAVFDRDSFFFAVLSIFITMMVMGYIENGLTKRKEIKILSPEYDSILTDITKELGKSVTILPAKGSYEGKDTPMLMLLIDAGDYRTLIDIVDRHDKTAFMVTTTVTDVHGRGFTYDSGRV
jgi:uncharacterized membrane-anchored protein YitT (DUF2179 family)